MPNVNNWFNNKEIVDLCTKLNCLNEDLGKVFKATLLGEKSSKYYRELCETKPEEIDRQQIIDEFIASTELGEFVLLKSEMSTKPRFIPK